MGDRTSVCLTVLKEFTEEAQKYFDGYEHDHMSSDNVFTHFSFYEVNYGNLLFLDDLQKAGIAFDSNWDHGSDYGPGTDYCRFLPDGSVYRFDLSDEYINPDLKKCMELIDRPEELKAFIVEHYNKVTPPSWEFQIEYGKLYRTKQLISS
jgi:hypothetical protein